MGEISKIVAKDAVQDILQREDFVMTELEMYKSRCEEMEKTMNSIRSQNRGTILSDVIFLQRENNKRRDIIKEVRDEVKRQGRIIDKLVLALTSMSSMTQPEIESTIGICLNLIKEPLFLAEVREEARTQPVLKVEWPDGTTSTMNAPNMVKRLHEKKWLP